MTWSGRLLSLPTDVLTHLVTTYLTCTERVRLCLVNSSLCALVQPAPPHVTEDHHLVAFHVKTADLLRGGRDVHPSLKGYPRTNLSLDRASVEQVCVDAMLTPCPLACLWAHRMASDPDDAQEWKCQLWERLFDTALMCDTPDLSSLLVSARLLLSCRHSTCRGRPCESLMAHHGFIAFKVCCYRGFMPLIDFFMRETKARSVIGDAAIFRLICMSPDVVSHLSRQGLRPAIEDVSWLQAVS